MIAANFHCHTSRCGHARGEDRQYVEAALSIGLKALGFSDHGPRKLEAPAQRGGYYMAIDERKDYTDSILALRDEYRGRIDLFVGYETEYTDAFPALNAALHEFPCDYLIEGQHFVDIEKSENFAYATRDDVARLAHYVDVCIEAQKTGEFLYLAHPDMIGFSGSDDDYTTHMGRLFATLKTLGKPVEINILGLREGRHYPCARMLKLASDHGLNAVIGVDSHSPEHLLETAPIERGIRLAAEYGLPLVDPRDLLA